VKGATCAYRAEYRAAGAPCTNGYSAVLHTMAQIMQQQLTAVDHGSLMNPGWLQVAAVSGQIEKGYNAITVVASASLDCCAWLFHTQMW
jgi:N-acetylglucosamine-6-phosphate deacetylase